MKIIRCSISLDIIAITSGDYLTAKKLIQIIKEQSGTVAVAAELTDSKLLAEYEIGDIFKRKEE